MAVKRKTATTHAEPNTLNTPFVPKARDEMPTATFDSMIDTGLSQAKNGESLPAETVFDDLLKGF